MRGKVFKTRRRLTIVGITPAHAGKSYGLFKLDFIAQDHPRACGEKIPDKGLETLPCGSPPRMRGKVNEKHDPRIVIGITPAHAGKRAVATMVAAGIGDHPRACGEKHPRGRHFDTSGGSPPRMRGKEMGPHPKD